MPNPQTLARQKRLMDRLYRRCERKRLRYAKQQANQRIKLCHCLDLIATDSQVIAWILYWALRAFFDWLKTVKNRLVLIVFCQWLRWRIWFAYGGSSVD